MYYLTDACNFHSISMHWRYSYLTCSVGKQPEYDVCFWFNTNQINSERPCRSPPKPLTCEHENCPLDDNPTYFYGCLLTHLAECRGAALGDLSLQHTDQFTELHTIIELLHEKLCSHLLACKVERHQMKSTVKCKWPCFFAWAVLKKRLLCQLRSWFNTKFFLLQSSFFTFTQSFCWRILKKTTQWQLGRVLYKLPQPHIVNHGHTTSPNKDHVDWIYIGNTNYNSKNTMCRGLPVLGPETSSAARHLFL